jgi:hypothetical protein
MPCLERLDVPPIKGLLLVCNRMYKLRTLPHRETLLFV